MKPKFFETDSVCYNGKKINVSLTSEKIRFLAWAWLAKPKVNVVIPKNQPLPKYLRKKTSKRAKYACHYATKKIRENNKVFGFGHHN